VGERLLGDRARVRLFLQRHRDRPLVVLADKTTGTPDPASSSPVEIALDVAVAEVRHDDHVAAVLGRVGETDRARQLGRDWTGIGRSLVVRGSPASTWRRGEEQELLGHPRQIIAATPRNDGTIQSALRRVERGPHLRGFPTLDGRAKVPMRPRRCSRTMRGSRRRPSTIAR
jgi:hypothetical protein